MNTNRSSETERYPRRTRSIRTRLVIYFGALFALGFILSQLVGLLVMATTDRAGPTVPAWRDILDSSVAAFVGLLVVIGFALVVSSRLAARILAISRAAERAAAGDLDARAPVDREDEIGFLAARVNDMIEGIENRRAEMEQEAWARTAELVTANEELRAASAYAQSLVVELESTNKELESFSYSVSHDLRTPLRSIDGFSLALLEDCGETINEQGKEHLQRIRAATQRMGRLIDDVMKLSLVTRQEMWHEPVDLTDLAQSVADELREAEPERNVEFVIEEGLEANGDEHLLEMAIRNLLENAWKFSGKHARATIQFGATQCDDERVYFVRDDGAGFDMAYADKLFGAFQRLHTDDEFPGTGIGLVTVLRIITRHGGRIWAESEVERGATFYFTLGGHT